nr:NYN domain-containing protein [Roseococcus sp. MDT2-1-1]
MPRFAVLIDGDNASPQIAPRLFEEIAKFGEATVRRIYGDFSSSRLKSWAEIVHQLALTPRQQFAFTSGKNASDIALVIDAMDLLHLGRVDGFCLVSSDSDFTGLASRLREHGSDVYGFGEQKTPESFRRACRKFVYTENLLPSAPGHQGSPVLGNEGTAAPPGSQGRTAIQEVPNAKVLLLKAVSELQSTEDSWVNLSQVGTLLTNLESDFDPRTYGCKKLSDLVRKTGVFEGRYNDKTLFVRPVRTPSTTAAQ